MTIEDWSLHPQLEKDCHLLAAWKPGVLLLHGNASLHWFLLVPKTSAVDLLDLEVGESLQLLRVARVLHGHLKAELGYPRVNVGALGLVVPQLHLHVVGRRPDDPCWPAPVWGNLPEGPVYAESELAALKGDIERLLPSGWE
ncbi:MAG: HIT family protein [Pseudomonadota bacterium]